MKKAVILLNLGGPDALESVRPFLFNLFKDKAILNLPFFVRYPLAFLLALRRTREATHIYGHIGGASPLLKNTQAQAQALEDALRPFAPSSFYRVFTLMRYWHPMAQEVAQQVKDYAPDAIVLLPLYPQFSTSTTQSSFDDFEKAWKKINHSFAPSPLGSLKKICCYPIHEGFVTAQAELIKIEYEKILTACAQQGISQKPRILFSAHGLPEKFIKAGDPYQWQCEQTTHAVVAKLEAALGPLDTLLSYQSRVGPLKWIEPYTDAQIERAGAEGKPIIIVPIAFVSEHSETLYEIEQEYRTLAAEKGAPLFARVPAVGTHPAFIQGLARLVVESDKHPQPTAPEGGARLCAGDWVKCGCRG